jgi:hypothetical protein
MVIYTPFIQIKSIEVGFFIASWALVRTSIMTFYLTVSTENLIVWCPRLIFWDHGKVVRNFYNNDLGACYPLHIIISCFLGSSCPWRSYSWRKLLLVAKQLAGLLLLDGVLLNVDVATSAGMAAAARMATAAGWIASAGKKKEHFFPRQSHNTCLLVRYAQISGGAWTLNK